MKVIQACVSWSANHQEDDEDNVDIMFFLPRFARLPSSYVPIVSTAHLVVRQLIGITRQACTSGTTRTYLTSEGSSMTLFTRVALRGSRGASTMPSQSSSPEHRTSFLRASMETTTKPSRRWQPLRVTSPPACKTTT
jgi:hypothetical protein